MVGAQSILRFGSIAEGYAHSGTRPFLVASRSEFFGLHETGLILEALAGAPSEVFGYGEAGAIVTTTTREVLDAFERGTLAINASGDALFFPPAWLHCVTTTKTSVGIGGYWSVPEHAADAAKYAAALGPGGAFAYWS